MVWRRLNLERAIRPWQDFRIRLVLPLSWGRAPRLAHLIREPGSDRMFVARGQGRGEPNTGIEPVDHGQVVGE